VHRCTQRHSSAPIAREEKRAATNLLSKASRWGRLNGVWQEHAGSTEGRRPKGGHVFEITTTPTRFKTHKIRQSGSHCDHCTACQRAAPSKQPLTLGAVSKHDFAPRLPGDAHMSVQVVDVFTSVAALSLSVSGGAWNPGVGSGIRFLVAFGTTAAS